MKEKLMLFTKYHVQIVHGTTLVKQEERSRQEKRSTLGTSRILKPVQISLIMLGIMDTESILGEKLLIKGSLE